MGSHDEVFAIRAHLKVRDKVLGACTADGHLPDNSTPLRIDPIDAICGGVSQKPAAFVDKRGRHWPRADGIYRCAMRNGREAQLIARAWDVKDTHLLVVAGRGEACAGGMERQSRDHSRVFQIGCCKSGGLAVPHAHVIAARKCQKLAIRAKDEPVDIAVIGHAADDLTRRKVADEYRACAVPTARRFPSGLQAPLAAEPCPVGRAMERSSLTSQIRHSPSPFLSSRSDWVSRYRPLG